MARASCGNAHALGRPNSGGDLLLSASRPRCWRDARRVVAALTALCVRGAQQRATLRREIACFHTNQQRMRYSYFRRLGLYIGRGVVESGCTRSVTQRLKRPGARRLKNHAHRMAQLRTAYLNDYLDDIGKFMLAASSTKSHHTRDARVCAFCSPI